MVIMILAHTMDAWTREDGPAAEARPADEDVDVVRAWESYALQTR